ncbi:MAG: DUF1752 domain-containing protein [Bacteroidales bacterium]|nr:DUF1752 domain-containing protein [Bacteroidales bacterium]
MTLNTCQNDIIYYSLHSSKWIESFCAELKSRGLFNHSKRIENFSWRTWDKGIFTFGGHRAIKTGEFFKQIITIII